MKLFKFLSIVMIAIVLVSCGGKGQSPTDYITFGQAWNHVSHSFSYWLWIAIVVAASGAFVYKTTTSDDGWDQGKTLIVFVLLALLFATILARPGEVAANTTVEQAARGVYIGY